MPVMPPMRNMEMNPSENSIGVCSRILPSQIVANQEKIFTPVGTAITMEVIMYGTRSLGSSPLVNMWCAQTVSPSTLMAMLDRAIILYPKIGLREKTGKISETMPIPGRTMMYTAGWE